MNAIARSTRSCVAPSSFAETRRRAHRSRSRSERTSGGVWVARRRSERTRLRSWADPAFRRRRTPGRSKARLSVHVFPGRRSQSSG